MSNVKLYINYFRNLAATHTKLQHGATLQTPNGPVVINCFARWNADEALTGLRSKITFPALLLEMYENETVSNSFYEVHERPKGAITVVASARPEDFASEEDAYELAECILRQLLQQIWADHYGPEVDRNTTPFREVYLGFTIVPVGPLFDNQFGYRVEFNFEFHENNPITQAPPFGAFLSF